MHMIMQHRDTPSLSLSPSYFAFFSDLSAAACCTAAAERMTARVAATRTRLMGALVPENVRGRFFAQRTRLSSIASFTALLFAGLILQLFAFLDYTLYGFLLIFAIGILARTYSCYQLSRLFDFKNYVCL